MKKTTNKTTRKARVRGVTRREFVGSALAAAGVFAKAPAFLRGQNLNNKLNIAFLACGGRANESFRQLTLAGGASKSGKQKADVPDRDAAGVLRVDPVGAAGASS